ncbi:MAG TPA: ATP-binding protein, partial [Bacteroidales bacterium]|nr:ATP-binding protein [Bacteroidales bacterium]
NDELVKALKNLPANKKLPLEKFRYYQAMGSSATTHRENADAGTIRVASERIDKLIKIVGEMVTFDSQLALFASKLQNPELTEIGESLRKLTERLREVAFDISLVPLSVMMLRFKRLVRDLSLSQGKQIVFLTAGEETQLDKTVVEHLYEPLMHILRNSISHGIESGEQRRKNRKVAEGTIKLQAYYSGPEVHIEISDDGQGFDTDKIRKTAIDKGFISKEDEKTDEELLNLTFLPGFSTMPEADSLSGRGVGMDVIRKKLQEINGEVTIDSKSGKGTTMKLLIPLTLSIVDGLSVRVDDLHLVLPVAVVDRIESVPASLLPDNKQVLSLNGESIPAIPLFFDIEQKPSEQSL